ncbi:hypothetical protein FKM82_008745 [Ascaphus truei]
MCKGSRQKIFKSSATHLRSVPLSQLSPCLNGKYQYFRRGYENEHTKGLLNIVHSGLSHRNHPNSCHWLPTILDQAISVSLFGFLP